MRIRVHTERGIFTSKWMELTKEEVLTVKELIQEALKKSNYFQMETDLGTAIISGDLLKTAVFELVN